MLRVVIDTNVLVSALLKNDGPPAFVLALLRRKMMALCLSAEIFDEYEAVLARGKFGGIKDEAAVLLSSLKKKSIWVDPKEKIKEITDDPADNKFLECAVEAGANFLITGNVRHFRFKSYRDTRIVNPAAFIEYTLENIIKL